MGYKILRAGDVGGPPLIVVKASSESVTSSTTAQDDNELLFPIGPNSTWQVRFVIYCDGAQAGDIKTGLSVPAGCTYLFSGHGLVQTTASDAADNRLIGVDSGTLGFGVLAGGTSVPSIVKMDALITNGATAGNVVLQWAQLASSGTATQVLAKSYLIAHRVA